MRPRILFVDDEPKILNGLRRALRDHESVWDMAFCADPAQALKDYAAQPYDIVVSDVAMPVVNGLSMVTEMRTAGYPSNFIMLTGTADLQTAVEAINHVEVFRFFTKPCATEALAEGIAAGLEDLRLRNAGGDRESGEAGDMDSISAAIGLAALNRLALGVIVANVDGRVLLANRAGGALLAAQDGLMLASGEMLRAASFDDSADLLRLIRMICDDEGNPDTAGLAIQRPSLKRPLIALVMPLHLKGWSREAVIFVADTEDQPLPTPEAIGKLFGLSRAESRIAHALAQGARIEEAAERCGVTVSTARSYLKQAFEKTNTGRQADLIKLILTSPRVY